MITALNPPCLELAAVVFVFLLAADIVELVLLRPEVLLKLSLKYICTQLGDGIIRRLAGILHHVSYEVAEWVVSLFFH